MIRQITNRDELPDLLNELGLVTHGVEVGTQEGCYAEVILKAWPGHLTCIDPWVQQSDYDDLANCSNEEHEIKRGRCLERLQPYADRCTILRTFSSDAALILPNDLDFVYLDARHDYQSVTHDLRAWAPKIKPHGILAGHDYLNHGSFQVERAVTDWLNTRPDVTLHVTPEAWPTWYVQMP